MRRKLLLLPAALAVTLSAHGASQLYRWVDANGQIHFSDVPVPNAKPFTPPLPRPADGAARYPNAPRAPQGPDAFTPSADCAKLRDKLAVYRAAGTITETDALGKTHTFTDAEKQQLIIVTEARAKKACGGAVPPAPASADATR
ncbi:MAG: DUF4124 domain-containing protein [Gammaproteobacteria bacterium]|nr:DUF4124 domain-containing protein [Gammaproteobacteria bacterium]